MFPDTLLRIYNKMFEHFGPQHWWPAETTFEVMVGAVLTQNTSWTNVEKAIEVLKGIDALKPDVLAGLPVGLLAEYIRPAGYYNIKAARLHNLCRCILDSEAGDLDAFLAQPSDVLRGQLLAVKGIGPETADAILLYAADYPVFVVDTYTHRILSRHDLIDEGFGYHEIQELFMDNLDMDVQLYNEYHALLVQVGKQYCKKSKPACGSCPLNRVEQE